MTITPALPVQRATTLDTAELPACLPESMRGASTVVIRIAAGMSGAGVYRVHACGAEYALKITAASEPLDLWRAKVELQCAVGDAGIAPRVVHSDATRRAVLCEFVQDRGFIAQYWNPATQRETIDGIGSMLRTLHALPIDESMTAADPLQFLEQLERGIPANAQVPPFVSGALAALRRDTASHQATRAADTEESVKVLSHNDVNPSNLVFDGTRVMLLDWQTPAPNDRYYDLATAALFLRMDEERCRQLLSSYTGTVQHEIPARFNLLRRTAALLSGMASLQVARAGGHAGSTDPQSAHDTPSLGDVYAAMRTGSLQIGSPEGQWTFGLALVRESISE